MIIFDTFFFFCIYIEDYDEEGAVAHVRRLLDVVACTSCFGGGGVAERGAKGGGAAEKPRRGKGNATEKPKSLKSPPPSYSPPRVTTESGSGTIGTDMGVDGEGETSGACPQLGSFYDFFSLAHLTPPVQCKRPFLLMGLDFQPIKTIYILFLYILFLIKCLI